MTFLQLFHACSENKYLLVHGNDGVWFAINGKIANLKNIKRKVGKNPDHPSPVHGYISIDFQEYISKKNPFI